MNSNLKDEDAIPWEDWSRDYSLTQIEYGYYDENGSRKNGYTGFGKDSTYWWIPEEKRNFLIKCIGGTKWIKELIIKDPINH